MKPSKTTKPLLRQYSFRGVFDAQRKQKASNHKKRMTWNPHIVQ